MTNALKFNANSKCTSGSLVQAIFETFEELSRVEEYRIFNRQSIGSITAGFVKTESELALNASNQRYVPSGTW
jgi:hypothetical protein